MKPRLLILIILTGAFQSFGQKGIEVQLIINPTFSTRYLTAPSKSFLKTFNEIEKGIISYDAGVLVVPFRTQRFTFGTGLILSRKGFIWADYTATNMSTMESIDVKITESLYYLEIPLRVTYSLSKKSNNYIVLGILNDIFLSSKIKVTDDLFAQADHEKRKYNLGVNLGLGHNFKIKDSIHLGIEPNLKFQSMHYLAEDHQAKRFLYTIGLTLNTKFGL